MDNTPRALVNWQDRGRRLRKRPCSAWLPLASFGILLVFLTTLPRQASLQNLLLVKHSSSAIAITDDGSLLLVVNPDSNSVSVMDPAASEKLAELTVGDDPRTVALEGSRAYVANRGSNTVSVIDLGSLTTVATIEVEHQPYGVVVAPAGDLAFVANSGSDSISVIETATLQVVATSRCATVHPAWPSLPTGSTSPISSPVW